MVTQVRETRVEEEARSILAWASVLGREFTLHLLEEVTGLEEARILDVVDKAVAARVFTPRPALGQKVYAFVDNQAREVLYEGIGPARRQRYHLKVGQAIEKIHVRRLEEHYDALAHHFLEGNDLQKAAEYAIKAGLWATSTVSRDFPYTAPVSRRRSAI
jgi:predicted ATPase